MDSQMVWTWITRVGAIVGLIGGGLAIYEFFEPIDWRRLLPIFLGIYFGHLVTSGRDRARRVEAKVDRLLAHLKINQPDE